MTRKILFRGKRLDTGEWVYGDLQHDYDGEPRCISDFCGANPIDPSTVGQYTGLTANGKKIFEGDIIESDNGHISAIMKVEYGSYRPDMFFDLYRNEFGYVPSQNLYGYYLENKNEQMLVVDSPHMEVIGNKWDNPELLEGKG